MDREIPKKEIARRRRKQILIWGGGVAAAMLLVLVLAQFLQPTIDGNKLKFSKAEVENLETTIFGTGVLSPEFEEIVTSPISARLLEVYKHEGDTVTAGTPILRLDLQTAETELNNLADEHRVRSYEIEQTTLGNSTFLSNLEMQIEVKQMDVNRKRVEVQNERRLDSLGSGTGDRVREAELAYNTGLLELQQLRRQLDNERRIRDASLKMKNLELSIFEKNAAQKARELDRSRIRASRNATVTYIRNKIGEQISAGERVAVIADLSSFSVTGEIPESYSGRIFRGSDVKVRVGQNVFTGKVSRVNASSVNGNLGFDVSLDDNRNPRFRPGLKVDINVVDNVLADVVTIANGSYYKGPGEYDMFILGNDGKLHRRRVNLGEANFQKVAVISGIESGEEVVVSDMTAYVKKSKIKIK